MSLMFLLIVFFFFFHNFLRSAAKAKLPADKLITELKSSLCWKEATLSVIKHVWNEQARVWSITIHCTSMKKKFGILLWWRQVQRERKQKNLKNNTVSEQIISSTCLACEVFGQSSRHSDWIMSVIRPLFWTLFPFPCTYCFQKFSYISCLAGEAFMQLRLSTDFECGTGN